MLCFLFLKGLVILMSAPIYKPEEYFLTEEEPLRYKYLTYLKDLFAQNWLLLAAWLGSALLMAILCWIYAEPVELALLYLAITAFFMFVYLGFYLRRLHTIKHLLAGDVFDPEKYPRSLQSCAEKMEELNQKMISTSSSAKKEQIDLENYFSLWAHQIKLPLAAMELQLQLENPDREELIRCEKRIARHVSQAMIYVRLDGSDYRIQNVNLESVIRPLIRENASSFIHRHITIDCDFDQGVVCTDRKWIGYVIEQLLSNALKYTPDFSTLTIKTTATTFSILDEGCGIAKEDLPRIYEKGFTGKNGHNNLTASSGFGLYLSDEICHRLGCTLKIENRKDLPEGKTGVIASIEFPPALYFKD